MHKWGPQGPNVSPNGRREGIGARGMRALIANEPAIYREAICAALRELRPGIEVFTAEPEDLDGEFLRLMPELVVCSQLSRRVESDTSVWVELYPEGASHAVVRSIDGSCKTLFGMNFDKLLSILDGI